MPDITVSKQARQDLVDIWLYIADNNPYAADTLLDRLHEKISYLADHPLLGPTRPDIAPNLRYLVSGNYLILYRLLQESVEIVRVLHGARNLSAHLRYYFPNNKIHFSSYPYDNSENRA